MYRLLDVCTHVSGNRDRSLQGEELEMEEKLAQLKHGEVEALVHYYASWKSGL